MNSEHQDTSRPSQLSLVEVIDRQDRLIEILLKLEPVKWLRDDREWLKEQAAQRRN